MIGTTEITISGGPFSPQAITSIVSFGGFDPILNSARQITSGIHTLAENTPQVRMTDEKFPTLLDVKNPAFITPAVLELNTDRIITQTFGGVVGHQAIATLETITTEEVTKFFVVLVNEGYQPGPVSYTHLTLPTTPYV